MLLTKLSTGSVRCIRLSSCVANSIIPQRLFSTGDFEFGGGYLGTGNPPVSSPKKPRVFITGAAGQIGQELVPMLREQLGDDKVLATDVRMLPEAATVGPYGHCDVTQMDQLAQKILEHRADVVVHLASVLSAIGEQNPQLALRVNTRGVENVLELCRMNNIRCYIPSTIAVFGDETPKVNTPDLTVMRPSTMYGVTKVHLELLGMYYHNKFGVDFRSLRYPGIISWKTLPGGGTTDYAVDIYHSALKKEKFKCFLNDSTKMPMMYMPDCLKATVGLILAPEETLHQRVYNVTGMSFTPKEIYESIRSHLPDFEIEYEPDFRQEIANTWPESLDDSPARRDWGWQPDYDLSLMTADILKNLKG